MQNWLLALITYLVCLVAHVTSVNPAREDCLNYESKNYNLERGCDCVVYQSYGLNDGRFTSPNFPVFYPANTNCILYSFFGDAYEIIELTFLEFELKMPDENGNCTDFVRIFQNLERPEVNEFSKHDVELCGNYSSLERNKFYSSDRGLILEFHSESRTGHNNKFRGFRGVYKFLDKRKFVTTGERDEKEPCAYDFRSNVTHKSGQFFSPFYPQTYIPNSRCRYRFFALTEERIRIIFTNIQLHRTDVSTDLVSCFNAPDVLTVYDGKDTSSPVIAQFCGVSNTEEVISMDRQLLVTFNSDHSKQEQGFAATYEFIAKTNPVHLPRFVKNNSTAPTSGPASRCGEIISSLDKKNGTIESPNYPYAYPSDLNCRFVFQGVGRERIQLRFVHMNLHFPSGDPSAPVECANSDSIVVYVPINGRNEVLGTYCGDKLPPTLMSNTHSMTVEFKSYRPASTITGFRAIYEFVTNFGITTGLQDNRGTCVFNYKSSAEQSGKIQSPNYPGLYPRNTECHYIFYGRGKERVHITFLFFEVDGISPRCEESTKSDYVSFSNFAETEDRKMHRLCGTVNQPAYSITSDGAFFRVTFKSNDVYDAHGFQAMYQFHGGAETTAEVTNPLNSGYSANSQRPSHTAAVYVVLLLIISNHLFSSTSLLDHML